MSASASRPSIVIVAALDEAGVIGKDGALPWHLPRDLAHFKALTLGKPVLMGRKTFESIGRPLPRRRNVVLSRSLEPREGIELARSVEEALALLAGEPEWAVIGGAELFERFLPIASRLELTHVEARVDGDVRFPRFDPSGWALEREERHAADAANAWPLRFASYARRATP